MRSRLLVAVLGSLLTLALFGSAVGTVSAKSSASNTPVEGGTLTAARECDVVTWDPALINENCSLWAAKQVEGTLVQVTPNGKGIEPDIAKSWTITSKGLVYTFHLNPQAKFCNGTQITSSDVIYSFTRESAPSAIVAWQFPSSFTMSAPNATTVVLTLKQPEAAFISFLTLWGTAISSQAYGDQVGSQGLATDPLGSGPFCLASWERGTAINLTRNPYYWLTDSKGRRLPYLNAVHWEIITNDNARVLALESGQVQAITPVPPAQYTSVSHYQGVVASESPLLGEAQLFVNVHKACLSSVDVRQALNYAVDQPALIKAVLFGHGIYVGNPLDNAEWSTNAFGFSYDLTKARHLIAISPCKHGFTTTAIYDSGDTVAESTLTILKAEWAKLGVTLNILSLESGSEYAAENAGNFDMYWNVLTNDIYDPAENLDYEMLPSSAGGSDAGFTGWSNATVTKLVPEAAANMNSATRARLYREIQQIYVRQGPLVYLFTPNNLWATRSDVGGFSEFGTGTQDLTLTWLKH